MLLELIVSFDTKSDKSFSLSIGVILFQNYTPMQILILKFIVRAKIPVLY